MPARRARLAPQAAAWLKAEIAYIAERDPTAARQIAERFRTARRNLGLYPKLGSAGAILGTRRFVLRPYILTIRHRGDIVEIVAIRHARQADAYAPEDV